MAEAILAPPIGMSSGDVVCTRTIATTPVNRYIYKYARHGKLRRRRKIEILSEKVTSEEVLRRTGEKRRLVNNILSRKHYWIGHILRTNCLLHDGNEGQIVEVKEVGRRRT